MAELKPKPTKRQARVREIRWARPGVRQASPHKEVPSFSGGTGHFVILKVRATAIALWGWGPSLPRQEATSPTSANIQPAQLSHHSCVFPPLLYKITAQSLTVFPLSTFDLWLQLQAFLRSVCTPTDIFCKSAGHPSSSIESPA